MVLALADIVAARHRIASGIYFSPCPESIPLSEITGVGPFASSTICSAPAASRSAAHATPCSNSRPEHRAAGVVAASAGNHALGLAYHGHLLSIDVTVVMPKFAPLIKITTCRRLGANGHSATATPMPMLGTKPAVWPTERN